ncbi:hypothetical protein SH1V18_11050 [Vallitalea longa]|uniref:RNA polymerase sigma-70 region 4 domain-containing protein n=1 Tax=Vallitalea longa TaxID=2936439 RepID=A0A9W5Y9Q1_9FIRM|nr:sigma-70 family RNA polymerase sigma factor [Vallitalea longa]GKX28625.1 hypothetical protein SH1V18_11050 [Vallitalea longa]
MLQNEFNENRKKNLKKLEDILREEEKNEKNQKRRYYRHNISYEHLEEKHFYYKSNTTNANDIIDSLLEFQETLENKDLYQSFRKLKPKDIEIIKMRYVDQLSFKEIAEQLDMKEDTVGKRHRRAIDKLRKGILKPKK